MKANYKQIIKFIPKVVLFIIFQQVFRNKSQSVNKISIFKNYLNNVSKFNSEI
jgi:hypothetical protein